MGFGSYDESEQEKQEIDASEVDDEGVETTDAGHDGDVEFEFSASNDELLDQLREIKGE